MIGTRLAHYEITGHLGSGGMGDVYQASDSKLGRSVAIKLLPEAFTHGGDRAARFDREARVLASLNHPNIAAIYGIEQSGGRKFLVMELVPGETLAERIKRGPIPTDDALPIAKQIADGLEAAHEKGIVHRDLKPANIKITSQGQVKILDFGLAKAFEAGTSNVDLSQSPTLSMAATNAGVILGTAAYMSPEQAKGREVDRRTDIFAFGAVLYEMLTGRSAFEGEDLQDILGAVLKSEPDWTHLPTDVPPLIPRLLRLCLQKDAKKRRQTATDVRIDIEDAFGEPVATRLASPPARGARLPWIAFACVAILAAMLAVPALRHLGETPPSLPETRLEIVTPVTSDPISFALSPDGRQIVFVASDDGGSRLWLRSLAATAAQPLTGTEGASYPFWSPDSRSVGFFADGKLKRLDIDAGSPQTLATAAPRGATWNEDGVILFPTTFVSPLFRISASGGEAVAVTKLEKHSNHRFPQFLSGGRQFLFYAQGPLEPGGIYLGSLDAPETKRLTAADAAGVYAPVGWLMFVRAGTLLAQRLDLTRQALTGAPMMVADPVAFDAGSYAAAVSVSAAGLVAYRTGGAHRLQLTWFDRAGGALGTVGAPDENLPNAPRLSTDGRRVAVHRIVQGNSDIWLLDAARTTRLTFDAGFDRFPVWSPDGRRIVFFSNRKGHNDLYQKAASGVGSEEPLVESAQDKMATDWSADGRFILYHFNDPDTSYDISVLPMEGDRTPFVFLRTSFDELRGQFSPNGEWVAYQSNESGRYEIYVRPFPGPGGPWQISTEGGIHSRWGTDGKELYYIAPDGKLMTVPIAVNDASLEPGTPAALFAPRIFGGGTDGIGRQYDVARDGRFLINTVLDDTSSPITVVHNWKP